MDHQWRHLHDRKDQQDGYGSERSGSMTIPVRADAEHSKEVTELLLIKTELEMLRAELQELKSRNGNGIFLI